MLKAVSLNAEDTSEGTLPAVFVDSDKDRANLNKPPEYDQIRRLLHSASLSSVHLRVLLSRTLHYIIPFLVNNEYALLYGRPDDCAYLSNYK